jgi:chromosome segregation protein
VNLEAQIGSAEAALESEKAAFIEQEKELQGLQQGLTSCSKPSAQRRRKSLAAQQLKYLGERQTRALTFFIESRRPDYGLDESIRFTQQQIPKKKTRCKALTAQLESIRKDVDARRVVVDENRNALNTLAHRATANATPAV